MSAALRRIEAVARARGWAVARGFRGRLVGWIGRRTLDAADGLCLAPCRAIHTFGMRVSIDVLFIDGRLRIVRCVPHLPPGRLAVARTAIAVIELPAGAASAAGLRAGSTLTATPLLTCKEDRP